MESYQKRKIIFAASGGIAGIFIIGAVILGILAIMYGEHDIPDAVTQKPAEIEAYLRSEEFQDLHRLEQIQYIKQMLDDERNDEKFLLMKDDKELTPEQRKYDKEVLEPLFIEAFFWKLDEYSNLKPAEKEEFLANLIDRLERLEEKEKQLKGKSSSGDDSSDWADHSPAEYKQYMDEVPPTQRAQLSQFIMDLIKFEAKRKAGSFN